MAEPELPTRLENEMVRSLATINERTAKMIKRGHNEDIAVGHCDGPAYDQPKDDTTNQIIMKE
jgi:hypothetical protein